MWNKIYLIALAVLFLPMAFLTYYSWSWLQSIGAPLAVAENYNYYSNISWTFLGISTIALLILANILLWKTRRAWALWTTLLFFSIFIIARYFWLDEAFFQFKKSNNLADGYSLAPLVGVFLCAIAAVVVFFDQFLVKRLTDKMHPIAEIPATPIETANSKNEIAN